MKSAEYCYVRFTGGRVTSCTAGPKWDIPLYDLDPVKVLANLQKQGWYLIQNGQIPENGVMKLQRDASSPGQIDSVDKFQVKSIPIPGDSTEEFIKRTQREMEIQGWDLVQVWLGGQEHVMDPFLLFTKPTR